MKNQSFVTLFLDHDERPIGEYPAPVTFDLDTRKLEDGEHLLKIVSRDKSGREGIMALPFVVRNGPAITVEGLKYGEVVDGVLPVMINAYGKGDQKSFALTGSETPHSIPWWLIVALVLFVGWAGYFVITSLAVKL